MQKILVGNDEEKERNSMKKMIAFTMAAAMAMSLMISGCSKSDTSSNGSTSAASSESVASGSENSNTNAAAETDWPKENVTMVVPYSAGGDTTGSASPVTSIGSTGSGTAFSILPPYIAINIWKRLS